MALPIRANKKESTPNQPAFSIYRAYTPIIPIKSKIAANADKLYLHKKASDIKTTTFAPSVGSKGVNTAFMNKVNTPAKANEIPLYLFSLSFIKILNLNFSLF